MKNPEREFHKRLIEFFDKGKTSWGKIELVKQIDLIYKELLEDILESVLNAKSQEDLDAKVK